MLENGYFKFHCQLVVLADYHYQLNHGWKNNILKIQQNTFDSKPNIAQLQMYQLLYLCSDLIHLSWKQL